MSNITKHALAESLKKLLLKKPLNKITINDLTTDCGISRMAFYYHFKDIYDLVEWACLEESRKALQGKKTYDTWQEGLLQIFEAVYENKPFIINAYNAISREQIENFLFQLTHYLIMGVVEEQSKETLPYVTNRKISSLIFTNTVLSESCSTGFVRECDQIMPIYLRQTCASHSTETSQILFKTLQNMPNDKFLLIPYFL